MKIDTKLIEKGIDSLKSAKLKVEILKLLRQREEEEKASKVSEQEELSRQFEILHELILANEYHIREHKGIHPWQESVRTSTRNFEKVLKMSGLKRVSLNQENSSKN